jgi:hypothetical protein
MGGKGSVSQHWTGKAGELFLWALYDHHHLETGATMMTDQ